MATINGTAGADNLKGTAAADTLRGRGGNDTLNGGAGVDTLIGGSGNDTYIVNGDGDVISDSSGVDTVIVNHYTWTLGAGLENLVLTSSFQVAESYGNELDNVISNNRTGQITTWIDGAGGNDTLLGGSGQDCFEFSRGSGNYGSDRVNGGSGEDAIWVGTNSAVVVDFRAGTVTGGGTSGSGRVTFSNIEVAASDSFNDRLIANNDGIVFYAGGGNDTLIGGAGNDVLYADYNGRESHGDEPGNDRLSGKGGNDRLIAALGNDFLNGGAGADHLQAGAGNDILVWDAADTRVDGGAGTDTLKSGDLDLTAVANTKIVDVERINLTGGGDDRLTLNMDDILDISSTTDTLKVLGNAGDSVDIVGSFTFQGTSGGYRAYQVGSATLLVDTDIATVI
jgi:Ca2+-binding RTX toxin-like protein